MEILYRLEGFFALALYDGATFTFSFSMQEHQPTVSMLKSAVVNDDPWPGLQLKLNYGGKERVTTVIFNDEMTKGRDAGYDVGLFSSGSGIDLYTVLAAGDNSVNFARQALPLAGAEGCPVGADSKNGGEVTFCIYHSNWNQ